LDRALFQIVDHIDAAAIL